MKGFAGKLKLKLYILPAISATGVAGFASHTTVGGKISGHFNRPKRCQKVTCQFSHVCKCCVGSQACEKAHILLQSPKVNDMLKTCFSFLLDGFTSGFELLPKDANLQCAETKN